MDALRNTISVHSIKTRQIVYQDPSGSFPAVGAVLNVIDRQGHTDWTRDISVNSVTLANSISGPGRLTYSNTGVLLLNGVPVGGGGGVSSVTGGDNITITGTVVNPIVNLDVKKDISMNKYEINDCKGISIVNAGFGTPGRISNTGTDLYMNKSLTIASDPFGRLILKGLSADQASLTYVDATDTLFIAAPNMDLTASLSGGGVGKLNINAELDLCGNPGTTGQVLTSQGPGVQPVWAAGGSGGGLGVLGRYWTKTDATIKIDSTQFPGLPASGNVKMRIEMMGGGGGGGGGATVPGGTGYNSAGGGGQGFVQSAVIIYPIGTDLIIEIGAGGLGGLGGTIFGGTSNGANGSPTYLKHPISNKILATALGAYGGQTDGTGGGGLSNGVDSDNNPNGSPGGEGGGYYGGASGLNGGISGSTSSGTGCGGGGGYGGGGGSSGTNGGAGDRGSCLIEIIDLLP
jgi:hypothetical protein